MMDFAHPLVCSRTFRLSAARAATTTTATTYGELTLNESHEWVSHHGALDAFHFPHIKQCWCTVQYAEPYDARACMFNLTEIESYHVRAREKEPHGTDLSKAEALFARLKM